MFAAATSASPLHSAIVTIFVAIAIGLLIGRIRFKGISLGMAGIFIVGIVMGWIGFRAGSGFEQLGVVFLLYGIGLSAGPMFFRALNQYGRQAIAIVAPMILVAALVAVAFIKLTGMSLPLAIGCFTGAMKNPAAFATAIDRFPNDIDQVAVGFGIGYPISLVLIVLLVQLIPALLRKNLTELNDQLEASRPKGGKIERMLVEITNESLVGKPLCELQLVRELDCRIQLVLDDERLIPIPPDMLVNKGMIVLVIGPADALTQITQLLGQKSDVGVLRDAGFEQADIMITSPQVAGHTLGELNLPLNYGVVVREVTRLGNKLVPHIVLVLHARDVLHVDGPQAAIQQFAHVAGHRPKEMQQTDMLSLSVGIGLGLLLGSVTFSLPGNWQFNLGLAGGPLIVALLLGHFGHFAGVVGQFPPATQLFLMRLGLSLLLAASSVHAGAAIGDVFRQHGLILLAMILTIAAAATTVGLLAARLFASNLLQALESLAGALNATPAHERIASQADSDLVLVMFTTAYVFAMLLMVLTTEILIAVL
jgi:putative transport protein